MAVKKIKDLNPARPRNKYGVYSRFNEYFNLLLNAVKIVSTQKGDSVEVEERHEVLNFEEERFIKRGLFQNGAMGYDKITRQWYYCYGQGLNEYGNPVNLTMVTANGKTFERPASYDKEDDAHVRVDYKVSGIGSGSCGPALLEQYRLSEKEIHFQFTMKR